MGLRQVSWAALVALLPCDGLKAAGEPALPDALAPVDAASENKRLVFVTAAQVDGAFASGAASPWAAADAICASEGIANSLAGNARRIPQFTGSDWTQLGGRTCDVKRRFLLLP